MPGEDTSRMTAQDFSELQKLLVALDDGTVLGMALAERIEAEYPRTAGVLAQQATVLAIFAQETRGIIALARSEASLDN
jgi:hypothetical protein